MTIFRRLIFLFIMNDKQESALKWLSNDISRFLLVYRIYDSLWDTANENYMRKNTGQNNMINLKKKKIKNIKDAHRHEANKVKKSTKSGAGVEDAYKPKLNWFYEVDSFKSKEKVPNCFLLRIQSRAHFLFQVFCTSKINRSTNSA